MAHAQRQESRPPAQPPQGAISLAEFWSRLDPDAEKQRGPRRPAARAR